MRTRCAPLAAALAAIATTAAAWAWQGPDLVVCRIGGTGTSTGFANYGPVSGIRAFAAESVVCNYGDSPTTWIGETTNHPIFSQTFYRLRNGRLTQLGQAWVKHGGFAAQVSECGLSCQPAASGFLGVGCCDAYSAGTNGTQFLGPKSEVNPTTGEFLYPFCSPANGGLNCPGTSGNAVARRLQVHDADLDTSDGVLYFFQIHIITPDEINVASPATDLNNASYRRVNIGANLNIASWAGSTIAGQPAIHAWKLNGLGPGIADPDVVEAIIDVAGDGRFHLAAKATSLGGGLWQYEYAVQNYNSHRAGASFTVPLPRSHATTNIGFNDVDSHSGEPFSNDDWLVTQTTTGITWSTLLHTLNPNANALRWDSLYNFRFRTNLPPAMRNVSLGLFRPTTRQSPEQFVTAMLPVPDADCNSNGIADSVEIAGNPSLDLNGDGVIDTCPLPCTSDINADGLVNVTDLLAVIAAWGECEFPGNCPPDIAPAATGGDGIVNVSDLLAVIASWGPC